MSTSAVQEQQTARVPVRARRAKANGHAAAWSSPLTAADMKAFAKLNIDPQLLEQAGIFRVDTAQAQRFGFVFNGDLAGVCFPYCDDAQNFRNGRIRRDNPETDLNGKPENKYISMPSGKTRLLYRPPGATELLKKPDVEVILVEAEKSALAITAAAKRANRPLVALGLGGCWGWSQNSAPMPDLSILRHRSVRVMLDANVASNPDVQEAEMRLCVHLTSQLGASVACHHVPEESNVNGPDDFLAKHADRDFWRLLDNKVEPWLDAVGESYEQYANAKPPEFVIDNFLQSGGLTLVAGLSGHGKTWVLLSMVKSLLTGTPLFGEFKVLSRSQRVIYLTPEIGLGAFRVRAEKFRLGPFVKSRQLLVRTWSAYPMISLTDPALLLCARGAHIFLDTAVRFMEGDESSSTDNDRGLAAGIFALLNAGALSVTAAHHSAKSFQKEAHMVLENVLRGTGDIGAMAITVWGVRQLDRGLEAAATRLYVENVKARDFTPVNQFQLLGRPHIDEGRGMVMDVKPGKCPKLADMVSNERKGGRPNSPEKLERLNLLVDAVKAGKTNDEMRALIEANGFQIQPSTLKKEIGLARQQATAKY
jgi:hypothetical protein